MLHRSLLRAITNLFSLKKTFQLLTMYKTTNSMKKEDQLNIRSKFALELLIQIHKYFCNVHFLIQNMRQVLIQMSFLLFLLMFQIMANLNGVYTTRIPKILRNKQAIICQFRYQALLVRNIQVMPIYNLIKVTLISLTSQ